MPTLSPTILTSHPRKDGRFTVKIRLSHNDATCYLPTTIIIGLPQWNGKVIKHPDAKYMNAQIEAALFRYTKRIDDFGDVSFYTCSQLKRMLLHSSLDMEATFEGFSKALVDGMQTEGRTGTADVYSRHAKVFMDFMGGDISLAAIRPETIHDFGKYLATKRGLKTTYSNSIMRSIKAIVNRTQKERVVKYEESPFVGMKIPSSPVRDCALSVETINRIREADLSSRPQQMARDLFMLSFYCGGMNFVDMLDVDWREGVISYERQKVRHTSQSKITVKFTIPDQARAIARRWMTPNGRLHFLGYHYKDVEDFRRYVTRKLKLIEEILGLKEHIMFYSARKSFAQFAADLGFPDAVIDYCLGHSPRSRGIISYYAQVRPQQANIVLRRVADYLERPERYEELLEMRFSCGLRLPEM